jgi:hypothetical protein
MPAAFDLFTIGRAWPKSGKLRFGAPGCMRHVFPDGMRIK